MNKNEYDQNIDKKIKLKDSIALPEFLNNNLCYKEKRKRHLNLNVNLK